MFTGSPRAIDIERSPLPYRCRYSGNMKLRALAMADYVCVGAPAPARGGARVQASRGGSVVSSSSAHRGRQ